jgi:thioredoxin-dependent peroxiredoxin
MVRLEKGTIAPAFAGMTPQGEKISLTALDGVPIWLAFYRYAGCPLCNLHLYEASLQLDTMPRTDLAMIAVFESSHEKFANVHHWVCSVPLKLVSDPKKKLYETFGVDARLSALLQPTVLTSLFRAFRKGFRQGAIGGDLGQVPGHFLIDEKGRIEHAHYGRHIDDHIPWSTIQGFLSKRAAPKTKKAL